MKSPDWKCSSAGSKSCMPSVPQVMTRDHFLRTEGSQEAQGNSWLECSAASCAAEDFADLNNFTNSSGYKCCLNLALEILSTMAPFVTSLK